MNELQGILDREAQRVSAEPGALEAVLHHVDRRRRNRRVATTIFALALAALALGTLVKAFDRGKPSPALPLPIITVENVGDLRMAWTASQPGGCCPTATVSGNWVYVGGKVGLSAYPVDCGTGGTTCRPAWFGAVTRTRHYMRAPVAAGDMVFVTDDRNLYAFSIECASGGARCEPSWTASPPHPVELSAPAVGGGLVFVSTASSTYAYPVHCSTDGASCQPVWSAPGGGPPTVVDSVVYGFGCRATTRRTCDGTNDVSARSVDCIAEGGSCEPLWFGSVRGAAAYPSAPLVADDRVYFAAGDRLYGFPVHCRDDGGRCQRTWLAVTDQPLSGVVNSWVVQDGSVFVGAIGGAGGLYSGSPGTLYSFPIICGASGCLAAWTADLDGDAWLAARNGVLIVGTYGGSLQAFPTRCTPEGGTCSPVWSYRTFDGGLIFDHVTMTDSTVCAGGDSGQVYCFAVPIQKRSE